MGVVQEGRAGRQFRQHRRFHRRALQGQRPIRGCRAAVRLRLLSTDLLRLLRLHRHRARLGKTDRRRPNPQFQHTLFRRITDRVLAPLAHLAVDLATRLPLHPAGRPVGRRRHPVHPVGRVARRHAGAVQGGTGSPVSDQTAGRHRQVAVDPPHLPYRLPGMDPVPRPYRDHHPAAAVHSGAVPAWQPDPVSRLRTRRHHSGRSHTAGRLPGISQGRRIQRPIQDDEPLYRNRFDRRMLLRPHDDGQTRIRAVHFLPFTKRISRDERRKRSPALRTRGTDRSRWRP